MSERLQYLTKDEARTVLERCRANRDRAIMELLLHTGLRVGEAAGLQVRDFDREGRTIRVSRIAIPNNFTNPDGTPRTNKRGYAVYGANGSKRGKKSEIVIMKEDGTTEAFLPDDFYPWARKAREAGVTEFVKLGTKGRKEFGRVVPLTNPEDWTRIAPEMVGRSPTSWMWTSQRTNGNSGSRLTYEGMRRTVVRALRRADLPDHKCHPHVTRHTFAVHYLRGDGVHKGDLRSLQRILGHASIVQTSVYLQFVTDDLVSEHANVNLGF